MRSLMIQVPNGEGEEILKKTKQLNGKNTSLLSGFDDEGEVDIVFASFSNSRVEQFLDEVNDIKDLHITLVPRGVMALYPPDDQAPEQVTDIEMRSPIEIFLSGLQSIGSWTGFIGYATITSIIVWIGLYTNTSYLLVAAMLIAPFAGPAMNTAIATARGDWPLLRQGMIRYFVSIFITIAGTFLLSLLLQQDIPTPLMVGRSQISSVAVLLPLSAGAAGALNLVQSERNSLVSGAAVGMLVAASLAPPAGIVGMALAIGKWEMVTSGVFLLFLQLVGINLTGSLLFRLFGINTSGPRYSRGKKHIFVSSLFITTTLLGALFYMQLHQSPDLQRSSRAQRAAAEIHAIVEADEQVNLIEANVRFTRADISDQNSLLCILYVQRKSGSTEAEEAIKKNLVSAIQQGLIKFNVVPLIDIIVIDPP